MNAHQPVLLSEVITNLAVQADGIYIDATFGRGGHARAILQQLGPHGRLYAFDKDPAAIEAATNEKIFQDSRFRLLPNSFTYLNELIQQESLANRVNGILFDLGVSSPQLDDAQRGFSFLKTGPLDMRMNPLQGISAAEWLNQAKEAEISNVLKEYGEEKFARRIAAAIVSARQLEPLTTTTQLAAIVAKANPKWEPHKHPATRSFQAIRIFINQELAELSLALQHALDALAQDGRLLVISFHSLEDRIVKQFIQTQIKDTNFPDYLPVLETQLKPKLRKVAVIKPTAAEIADNPRARSAILRVAEKR